MLYNLEERKASIEFVIYGWIFTCCIRVQDLVQEKGGEKKEAMSPEQKLPSKGVKVFFLERCHHELCLESLLPAQPCKDFRAHVFPCSSLSLSTLFVLGPVDLNPHPHCLLQRRFLDPMAGLRKALFNK